MAFSTDVNLPRKHTPRFPDRCVVCGTASPTSTVRLITGTLGWWTWILFHFGNLYTIKAPACPGCSWRLHLERLLSVILTLVLAFASFEYVWPLFEAQVHRAARRWAIVGLALVCCSPLILYQVFFPHPFDITAYSDSVDYEFRDPELALEFAELNQDAEWVKIS